MTDLITSEKRHERMRSAIANLMTSRIKVNYLIESAPPGPKRDLLCHAKDHLILAVNTLEAACNAELK